MRCGLSSLPTITEVYILHYFKRNIGDYHKKAGRLTMLQHGAYTLLIDACYDREDFPTEDDAVDWCWASSAAEIKAVHFVLKKFFTLNGDKYEQSRIREEIEKYHENAATNKRIAKEREAKKRAEKTKRERIVNESPPNQEPVTINQKPKIKRKPAFVKPTIEEIRDHCVKRGNSIDPESFHAFYESKGWKVGNSPMKSWKACIITWEKRDNVQSKQGSRGSAETVSDKLTEIARSSIKKDSTI